jgi:hypothetical protein
MANKADAKGNALLWIVVQVHLDKVKSNLIKGAHPVADSNLDYEKVCIDCTNGDTIELSVNDADESVYATLTLKQKETNPDKLIKGKLIYTIRKWSDEFEPSQIAAYLANLMYVITDVYAMYETGTFTALCMYSSESAADLDLAQCKSAKFEMV